MNMMSQQEYIFESFIHSYQSWILFISKHNKKIFNITFK